MGIFPGARWLISRSKPSPPPRFPRKSTMSRSQSLNAAKAASSSRDTSIFPGLLGIDVSRELDAAFAALSDCDRLIVDLRGNLGGGLGLLRLMSHLAPGKIPIGYSVTRKRAERGFNKESLRRFDWIPSTKLAIPLVALLHAGRDGSVLLMTEGLGPKKDLRRLSEAKPQDACLAALDSKWATGTWSFCPRPGSIPGRANRTRAMV